MADGLGLERGSADRGLTEGQTWGLGRLAGVEELTRRAAGRHVTSRARAHRQGRRRRHLTRHIARTGTQVSPCKQLLVLVVPTPRTARLYRSRRPEPCQEPGLKPRAPSAEPASRLPPLLKPTSALSARRTSFLLPTTLLPCKCPPPCPSRSSRSSPPTSPPRPTSTPPPSSPAPSGGPSTPPPTPPSSRASSTSACPSSRTSRNRS